MCSKESIFIIFICIMEYQDDDYVGNNYNENFGDDEQGFDLNLLANPEKMVQMEAEAATDALNPVKISNENTLPVYDPDINLPYGSSHPDTSEGRAFGTRQRSHENDSDNFPLGNPYSIDGAGSEDDDVASRYDRSNSSSRRATPIDLFAEKQREMKLKAALLYELSRYDSNLAKRFTSNSPLSDIQFELERVKNTINNKRIIETMRDGTYMATTFMEQMSGRYLSNYLHLKGWSTSILADLSSGKFDEVFLELYDKYKNAVDPPVEIKFLFMLVSSAVMYHFMAQMTSSFTMPQPQQQQEPQTREARAPKMKGPKIDIEDIVQGIRDKKSQQKNNNSPQQGAADKKEAETVQQATKDPINIQFPTASKKNMTEGSSRRITPIDNSDNESVTSSASSTQSTNRVTATSAPKKRRGRPPKKNKDDGAIVLEL